MEVGSTAITAKASSPEVKWNIHQECRNSGGSCVRGRCLLQSTILGLDAESGQLLLETDDSLASPTLQILSLNDKKCPLGNTSLSRH